MPLPPDTPYFSTAPLRTSKITFTAGEPTVLWTPNKVHVVVSQKGSVWRSHISLESAEFNYLVKALNAYRLFFHGATYGEPLLEGSPFCPCGPAVTPLLNSHVATLLRCRDNYVNNGGRDAGVVALADSFLDMFRGALTECDRPVVQTR